MASFVSDIADINLGTFMGHSGSSGTNTTNLREDPNRWLWIPIFGIVAIGSLLLWFFVVIGTAAVEGFHKDPVPCGVELVYLAGCVCASSCWLIVQRKHIHPFLCDLGYSIAIFVGRIVRVSTSLIFLVLAVCTGVTYVVWLLSMVALIFGFPSILALLVFIVLIALGISTYVAMIIDDKLNPTKASQPQR
jgi:hypothetical protein